MIRDTTRNPSGDNDIPNMRRRRSVSSCPVAKWDLEAAQRAFESQRQRKGRKSLRHGDPLAELAVIPKPATRSRLYPSLRKYMAGRSSLYVVAKALHDRHFRRRALQARMAQCKIWVRQDQKELVAELNQQSRDAPDLPEALSVRLRICRTTLVNLVHDLGMRGYRYEGFKDVYIFFKSAEIQKTKSKNKWLESSSPPVGQEVEVAPEDRITERLVNNLSLASASVVLYVGANHPPGGLPNENGLGHLYMSTGKVVSGESALALRVLDALSKK